MKRKNFLWLTAVVLVLGAATRLYKLTTWSLAGDELATLRDSLDPLLLPVKQLLFWLNHFVVAPFLPFDELGLRLLPLVFGIVGVAVLIFLGARLLSRRAGLLAGLLVVFDPWHLYWSQNARYYTLVFLLAAVAGVALYIGTRERSGRWIAAGVGATVLAGLAHPTGVLPAIGYLVWLALHAARRATGKRRRLLFGVVGASLVVGLALAFPLLRLWVGLEQEWGIGGLQVGLSYAVRLGLGNAAAAAAGVALLWLSDRRELSVFLASAVLVPVILFAVLGLGVSVHTGFLFATVPFALFAAASFLDRVIAMAEGVHGRSVVGTAAVLLVLAPSVPSLVSHYLDGSRPDFRSAARFMDERASAQDLVLTDHTGAIEFYAPELDTRPLRHEPEHLQAVFDSLRARSPSADLWVVPYVRSSGGFGLQGFADIASWVRPHCELSAEFGAVRIDHQRNVVPVWRCGMSTDRNAARSDKGRLHRERGN